MLMLLSGPGCRFLAPKFFCTICSKEPKIDFGSSLSGSVEELPTFCCVDSFFGEFPLLRLEPNMLEEGVTGDFLGGDTEGVRLFGVRDIVEVGSNRPLAAAFKKSDADVAGGSPLLAAASAAACNGSKGPTHCRIWSTKTCIGIFSPHFSQEILPVASSALTWPVNSC